MKKKTRIENQAERIQMEAIKDLRKLQKKSPWTSQEKYS